MTRSTGTNGLTRCRDRRRRETRAAHGRKVDDGRNAGEVLHQYACRQERDRASAAFGQRASESTSACRDVAATTRRAIAQRVGGEVLFPQSRGELLDLRGRVLADALQDVDQVVVRIDLMQPAGHDETLHDADVLGAEFGPAE